MAGALPCLINVISICLINNDEPLDTIQKEYNKISSDKGSGHGEFFSEYRHPYKCRDRFLSLLFSSSEFVFLAKSEEVVQEASPIVIDLK